MSELSSQEANRLYLLNKAKMLKNGEAFSAEIPGSDLTYRELQILICELSYLGVMVLSLAGCGECEAHKDSPIPHRIAFGRVKDTSHIEMDRLLGDLLQSD